jgi:hypothetical protein
MKAKFEQYREVQIQISDNTLACFDDLRHEQQKNNKCKKYSNLQLCSKNNPNVTVFQFLKSGVQIRDILGMIFFQFFKAEVQICDTHCMMRTIIEKENSIMHDDRWKCLL